MPRWQSIPAQNWEHAKELRHNLTPAERKLWAALKNSRMGVSFRRQHLVGPYIVDFCAPSVKLIVEIDGDSHAGANAVQHDESRSAHLTTLGYQIRRYSNRDVEHNLDLVLQEILESVSQHKP
jgi:very-short-patch-repair endonuclease